MDAEVSAETCVDCGVDLDDENAAVVCDEHPTCLRCEDPDTSCRGCRVRRIEITTDMREDRVADFAHALWMGVA